MDQSTIIEANAHEVWIAIFFGGAMAILIILLFLLDLRCTFISALALPTSVVGTFFVMYAIGFTINMMTLLGLSLAIGLLIDDAVVVRETITRQLERGDPPARAASEGTHEIALAVLATTFTLVAVFVPVAFMQGIVGQFFRQFGLTITVAVLISLFVAFTLDPMLSARLARARDPGRRPGARRTASTPSSPASARASTRTTGSTRARSTGSSGTAPSPSPRQRSSSRAASSSAGASGSEFTPKEDRNQLIVNLEYPPGTSLPTSSQRSAALERQVQAIPGVVAVYATLGHMQDARLVRWRVNLVDKNGRAEGIDHFKDRIRAILAADDRLRTRSVSDPPIIEGLGDWPPILMHVVGRDFGQLAKEADFMVRAMRSIPGLTDIELKDSPGKPELQVAVDREEAARARRSRRRHRTSSEARDRRARWRARCAKGGGSRRSACGSPPRTAPPSAPSSRCGSRRRAARWRSGRSRRSRARRAPP